MSRLLLLWLTCALLSCDQATSSLPKALPAQRYVLGYGVAEPLEDLQPSKLEDARQDLIWRRHLAWQILENIWQTESVGIPGVKHEVPRWLTWYGPDEFSRMFRELYSRQGSEARQARREFSEQSIKDIFDWNTQLALDLPGWGEDQIKQWIAEWQSPEQWHHLAGLARTLYSPLALKHIFEQYSSIDACYQQIQETSSDATNPLPPCEMVEFPYGSVIVKTSWTRLSENQLLTHYPTDLERMTTVLGTSSTSWQDIAQQEIIGSPAGFVLQTLTGQRFLLTGMHLMVKLSRHWFWVSMWWSKDSLQHFGFDRINNGSNWLQSYQMCVTMSFEEEAQFNPDSLADSIYFASQSALPDSWCSNPYLEQGQNNQQTNCIGCHQYAGLAVTSENILTDQQSFPRYGRAEQMKGFVGDYLWSFNQGAAAFAQLIRETIDHFDRFD